MTGREKVIKGLESLRDICNAKSNMATGKGKIAWAGYANAAEDALAMLKEQKSVEPKTGHWICGKYDDIFMCSSCEKYSMDDYPYCHWCGAKMKQEGR